MHPIIYIDTEFTDLLQPELLSLGMVTFDGQEHYVELNLTDPTSAETLSRVSDFVRHCGVLEQWGRVAGSAASHADMGQRTADWLQGQVARMTQPVVIGFDCLTDYELMEYLLRDAGRWDTVREAIQPVNVAEMSNWFDGALAADAAYQQLQKRAIKRHHALADAHALRAACQAVLTGKRVQL